MNILEINRDSKMKDLYNNTSGVDKQYFKHRIDQNLPAHSFKKSTVYPDVIKKIYSNDDLFFTIPKKGFMAKGFLKHKIKYPTTANAVDTLNNLSSRLGAYITKRVDLTQYGVDFETINPVAIIERINTSITNNIINLKEAIEPDVIEGEIVFYTPLLFSLNSDINHFLNLKHLQEIKMRVDIDDYSSLGLDSVADPVSHNIELLMDFMSIENFEEYTKETNSKDQKMALENNVLENGMPFVLSAGHHELRIRSRDLVKRIVLRATEDNPERDSVSFFNIKLTAEGETIYEASNLLECLLFNKNYMGLTSHRVPDATDDGIAEIQFDIPNYRNSNSGCLNLDDIHKDAMLSFDLEGPAVFYVNLITYDMITIKPDGLILKAEPNASPYLEEYDYEEPKEPRPKKVDVKVVKNIDKGV